MKIVIDLDEHRESLGPVPPALPSGGGDVIRVSFRPVDKLEKRLEGLSELPQTDAVGVGDLTVHSDGKTVSLIELAREDGELIWLVRAMYDEATLIDWLLAHRSVRRRLERKIRQARCVHDFGPQNRRTTCRRCNEERPVKYRVCRLRPRAWSRDRSRYDRTPMCRRRQGHEGPCSWEDDPGSRKDW